MTAMRLCKSIVESRDLPGLLRANKTLPTLSFGDIGGARRWHGSCSYTRTDEKAPEFRRCVTQVTVPEELEHVADDFRIRVRALY
jgi:hypothetical protein